MSSLSIALVVGALIAISGATGLVLQRLLPAAHTAERSRDMIRAWSGCSRFFSPWCWGF